VAGCLGEHVVETRLVQFEISDVNALFVELTDDCGDGAGPLGQTDAQASFRAGADLAETL
jgi:hypothetical protein